MTFIVIGASGYIGKPLFSAAGAIGKTQGTSTRGSDGLLPFRLDAPEAFDYGAIRESDTIFLTAAISAPDICSQQRDRAWAVNVTGTASFISRAIARGARVIFFSSDTVYGEKNDAFDERTPCDPAGDYAIMKHEVEKRFLGNSAFKTVRLSYVFSNGDKFTRYLVGCAGRNEPADIFDPFERAVVHRADVAAAVLALAQRWDAFPQAAINIGGPDLIGRGEFAQILKDNALPALRFRRVDPGQEFFKNRPRIINMTSPVLASLLGRPAHSLRDAARLEFESPDSSPGRASRVPGPFVA